MKNVSYSNKNTKLKAQHSAEQNYLDISEIEAAVGYGRWMVPVLTLVIGFLGATLFLKSEGNKNLQQKSEKFVRSVGEVLNKGLLGFGFDIRKVKNETTRANIVESVVNPAREELAEVGQELVDGIKPKSEADVHEVKEEFFNPRFTRRDVLTDKYDRLPDVFKIPDSLYPRVSFWFDVYTKYSSQYELVHHRDYPWIVFEVLDLRKFYSGPEHKWTKYHKARKYVTVERNKIGQALARLSRKKNLTKDSPSLTPVEQRYVEMLETLPGKNIRSKILFASKALRTQLGQKDFHKDGLANSSRYLPQMEQIFAQFDLPIELTRLPLVESSFNEKAVSKVGASGIWQFMPNIGQKFMKVGTNIDERNSPIKATEGAARLLLENFRMLKAWPLALTAYNHGPGGVRLAAKKAGSQDLATMIAKYNSPRFGFASKNFYTSFLAALHSERYNEEIFGDLNKREPLIYEEIRLSRAIRVRKVAEILGSTLEEVKLYNQDLKSRSIAQNIWLPAGYNLHVPIGRRTRMEVFLSGNKTHQASRSKLKPGEESQSDSKQSRQ